MTDLAGLLLHARTLLDRGEFDAADAAYTQALAVEPELAPAMRARAEIALARNDPRAALAFVQRSLGAAIVDVPSTSPRPLRVVQLASIHPGAHANTDRVLNPRWTQTATLLVEKWDLAWPLPAHDVIVNAIADPDICGPALALAAHLAGTSNAPVVNDPDRVAGTSRVGNAERLRGIEGLRVPRTERLSRERAATVDGYPVLLRAPGFHNGANFELVENARERDAALEALPEGDVLAIEYVDARGADGAFRKFRAMAIGGELFPAHLAIGERWKLHYFSSAMNDERRDEERSYLRDMRAHLGERAYRALERVVRTLGLDYCGIDFGLAASGDAIVFEANASMTVFLPDDDPENAYRREAVFAIDRALGALIAKRAGYSSMVTLPP